MNYLQLCLLIILFSCSTNQQKVPNLISPVVKVKNGLVKGVINESNTVVSFKGLPYAAAPVGALRWRESQPFQSWEGIRDASKFGPSAIQKKAYSRNPHTSEFMVQDSISEDCLFLNIWTSAKTADDKLPVFVFIHGGGFNEGSGSVSVYDGEALAKKGIIVATFNYRLLALGFLAHPALSMESPNHSSGNYGFLDQLAALKWVQANIAFFGGDPKNVTIGGQSAGAMSVNQLVASPLATGLFHRAITQSGSRLINNASMKAPVYLKDAEQQGLEFAKLKGASTIADLRAMSAEEVIAEIPGKHMAFRGSIDGYWQKDDMKSVFEKGKQNDTPFLTGINADETNYIGEVDSEFRKLYPFETDKEMKSSIKLAGQEQGRLNMSLWLEFRAKSAKTNSYGYYFDRAIPWPEHPEFGAFHTAEIPYAFNNIKKIVNHKMEKKDSIIANIISDYWVNFIKNGDPNGPGLNKWNPHSSSMKEVMRIGEVFEMIPIVADKRFDFLKNQLVNSMHVHK